MIAESIAAALLVPRSRSIASRISSERERPTTAARSSSAASRASSSWMSVWRRATAYYAIWFADTPLTSARGLRAEEMRARSRPQERVAVRRGPCEAPYAWILNPGGPDDGEGLYFTLPLRKSSVIVSLKFPLAEAGPFAWIVATVTSLSV